MLTRVSPRHFRRWCNDEACTLWRPQAIRWSEVQAQCEAVEKTCDAMGSTRDSFYVQLMEVLLPGSCPRRDSPQESCWPFGAASWVAFLHSPSHWARRCLWEASKSLLQTSSQLPLQWRQGRRKAYPPHSAQSREAWSSYQLTPHVKQEL